MKDKPKNVHELIMTRGLGLSSLKEARIQRDLNFFELVGNRAYKPKRSSFSILSVYYQFLTSLIVPILFGLVAGMQIHEAVFLVPIGFILFIFITMIRIFNALTPVRVRRKKIAIRRKVHKAYFERRKVLKELTREEVKKDKRADFELQLKKIDEEFEEVINSSKDFIQSLQATSCPKQYRSKINNPAHVETVIRRKIDSPSGSQATIKLKDVNSQSDFKIAGLSLAPAPARKTVSQIEIDL
ncbi:hypothetical protein [Pseudoalteromonas marina]|uniref:Uncharacterized protein n=1 Tax=Pseudoalteromonas marina TaxID=267375 RepID=A0ABT9FGE5_9GAMM|nr:hypothetical protein [Pseudoalteromonas marina]MDP2565858.1 hypothetical protein [Pseudoalteromonas marina]